MWAPPWLPRDRCRRRRKKPLYETRLRNGSSACLSPSS
jgi:hypothetical protein